MLLSSEASPPRTTLLVFLVQPSQPLLIVRLHSAMALQESSELKRSLFGLPRSHQWELLKSTIQDLYLDKGCSLSEVTSTLRSDYGFDAR